MLHDAIALECQLVEVNGLLAESSETPPGVIEFVERFADALAKDGQEAPIEDPHLLIELQRAVLAAKLALNREDPERRGILRVQLERMREIVRAATAEEPVSDWRSANEIATWLNENTGVSQRRLADLLGVGKRTFQRWVAGTSSPSGDRERRLRIVARLVNHLRYALTPQGVIGWFERPREELDGRAPRDLLAEPDALSRLEGLARRLREPIAT